MSEEKENWDSTGMYFGIYIGVVIMCFALIGTLLWISDIEKPAGISMEKAVVTKKQRKATRQMPRLFVKRTLSQVI